MTGADLLAELQSSLGATYTIDRELGGGGMARVFVAHERGLGRPVVIKLLNPELAEGINADRFEREIRLAASLQQANIVPLLSAGRAARYAYYTMPFVDGLSLRDRLARDSVLPISEGVSLLKDVARALAYAHDRGVVHRDIKPGNVLLSGGTAVVTDFGIAKALTAARGDRPLETLTQTGIGIGTPAYMAPEQAAGDPSTDHRADIYAFGCLAYEIFSGKPPFDGQAAHQIIAAHFAQTPRPITERRAELHPSIAALIAQCLEKDPGRRPQSAVEVLQALDVSSSFPASVVRRRPAAFMVAGGLAIAALVAVAAYFSFRSRATPGAVALEPLAFAAIPFRNVARDTALEYRADGIRDEILNGMSGVPGIQIVARNAARRYKNVDTLDERAVERELGARFLVTGTYRQDGGRIVVSAQLLDSMTRAELMSETFRREMTDFASLPGEISQRITATLRARYGGQFGEANRRTDITGTKNPAALEQYLIGQAQLRRRGPGVRLAVSSFEKAIKLDPRFARAHAALATALTFVPFFYGVPFDSVKAQVTTAAQGALALDSTLADPHTALAILYSSAGEWERSFAESDTAISLEPDNFEAHHTYGRDLIYAGRVAEALQQFADAKSLEPVSPLLTAWIAYGLYLSGRPDSAWKGIEQAISLDSTLLPVINTGSLVSMATGHNDVARRLMSGALPVTIMSYKPYVLAKLGDTTAAMRLISAMESSKPRPWFTDAERATVRLAIGDSAGALNALEQSARSSGPLWAGMLSPADAAYDPVRHTARFAKLMAQAGLNLETSNALRAKQPR